VEVWAQTKSLRRIYCRAQGASGFKLQARDVVGADVPWTEIETSTEVEGERSIVRLDRESPYRYLLLRGPESA